MVSKKWGFLLLGLAVANLGVLKKNDDPLKSVKAETVLYKQIEEQEKDGMKGAPTPSFTLYGHNDFLTASPMKASMEDKGETVQGQNKNEEDFFEEEELFGKDESVGSEEDAGNESVKKDSSQESENSEEDDWWTEDSEEAK